MRTTSPVDTVLDRLEGVRETPNGWEAKCPAHEDNNQSLAVATADDGKVLLNCHANCTFLDVVAALGMKPADLFPGDNSRKTRRAQIVAEYDYTDEDGRMLFQVVRYHPKTFRQRQPAAGGGWQWNLRGARRVLFKLHTLIEMAETHQTCYLVEGEKDALALLGQGVPATTNAGGAGHIDADILKPLARFSEVVVVADRDAAGLDHARKAQRILGSMGIRARVMVPAVDQPKADLSDHLAAGFLLEQLQTDEGLNPEAIEIPDASAGEGLAGVWLARRFAKLAEGRLAFCPDVGGKPGWLGWDGRSWGIDAKPSHEISLDVSRALRKEAKAYEAKAAKNNTDKKQSEDIVNAIKKEAKAASSLGGMGRLRDVASEIMLTSANEWDAEPHLLNLRNGVVDLKTGKLHEHDPGMRFTAIAPVELTETDPMAGDWGTFLTTIFPDSELRDYVQRVVGYLATGFCHEQVFFLWHGGGSNGKSVLAGVLAAALGGGFAMSSQFSVFTTATTEEAKQREIGRLRGGRFVVASEPKPGARLDTGCIKEVTGGEAVTGRHLFVNSFTYRPTWKLNLLCNTLPKIAETDYGTWRRIRAVPFLVQIEEKDIDRLLAARLINDNLEAVIAWIVAGATAYLRDGLGSCDAVAKLTADYREGEDIVGGWLADRCIADNGAADSSTPVRDLWEDFHKWADSEGHSRAVKSMNASSFGRDLGQRGYNAAKIGGVRMRRGLELNDPVGGKGDDVPF